MVKCRVPGCLNFLFKNKNVSYHNFPSNFEENRYWRKFCGIKKTEILTKNDKICSSHFLPECYKRDLQSELLGLPLKRILKVNSRPSVRKAKSIVDDDDRSCRAKRRQRQQLVDDLINESAQEDSAYIQEHNICEIEAEIDPAEHCENNKKNIESEIISLKSEIERLQLLLCEQKKITEQKDEKLLSITQKYEELKTKKISELKTFETNITNEHLIEQIKQKLAPVLSSNQIDLLLSRRKKVNWTKEELSMAFTIRYFSQSCYLFLRDQLKFPLPALCTLTRWASKISVRPGILHDILKILKVAGRGMSEMEKLCVLEFDEMAVTECFEYDLKFDQVLGYGGIAPKTQWGRVAALLYALFGIPIILLYLSAMGEGLSSGMRCIFRRIRPSSTSTSSSSSSCNSSSNSSTNNKIPPPPPPNVLLESNEKRQNNYHTTSYCSNGGGSGSGGGSGNVAGGYRHSHHHHSPTVPISICIMILICYITLGAVLFHQIQKWTVLESLYFCFSSLGTIGFGDLSPQGNLSQYIASGYIIIGMAVVAMCFSLIQTELILWLRKFGVQDTVISSSMDDVALVSVTSIQQQQQKS